MKTCETSLHVDFPRPNDHNNTKIPSHFSSYISTFCYTYLWSVCLGIPRLPPFAFTFSRWSSTFPPWSGISLLSSPFSIKPSPAFSPPLPVIHLTTVTSSQVPNPFDFVSTYSSISSSTSSSRLHVLTSRAPHSPLPLSDFCKHLSSCLNSGPFSFCPQTNVVHDTFLTFTSSSLAHSPEFTPPSTVTLPCPSRSIEHTRRYLSSYLCMYFTHV